MEINQSSASTAIASSQPSKGYYVFLVAYLVALGTLGSFVNDMISPALPAMCSVFDCSVSTIQLNFTAVMIGLGVGQLVLGPLSDRFGRKPALVWATLLFLLFTVVCLFSTDVRFFLICRFFQGLGACAGYLLAKTIPTDIYHGRQLAALMALAGAINGIAPASAPVLGGFVADASGWKGIFVLLAVFAVVVLVMTLWFKESLPRDKRKSGSIRDILSGYRTLLCIKAFRVHVIFKGLSLGVLFAYISSSPFILQEHYGLSQTEYGLLVGFNALFAAAGSILALKFRLLKSAAFAGAWLLAAAIAAEAVALWTVHDIWLYEGLTIVIVFSLGLIFSSTNTLAMNEGRTRAGEASAVIGVAGYIVGAVVTPLVGIGNVMHSTAVVYLLLGLLSLVCAYASRRLPADLYK